MASSSLTGALQLKQACENWASACAKAASVEFVTRSVPRINCVAASQAQVATWKRSHTQSSLYRTVRQASPETLPLLFAAIATEANEYGFTDDLVKLRTRKSQTAGLNSAIRTLKSKLEQYTGDRLADTVAARSSTAAVAQDATVAQQQAELEQLAAMQAAKHHELAEIGKATNEVEADLRERMQTVDATSKRASQAESQAARERELLQAKRRLTAALNNAKAALATARQERAGDGADNDDDDDDDDDRGVASLRAQISKWKEKVRAREESIQERSKKRMRVADSDPTTRTMTQEAATKETQAAARAADRAAVHGAYDTLTGLLHTVIAKQAAAQVPEAVALDVLHSCGGQQPVADLKRLVAERLAGSPHAAAGAAGLSTTTLRAVYSLVGNKHIKIDRSGGEATAVSLLL